MKNKIIPFLLLATSVVFTSCSENNKEVEILKKENDSLKLAINSVEKTFFNTEWFQPEDFDPKKSLKELQYTDSISKDTAKQMIDWYLNGTNVLRDRGDTIRSFCFYYPQIEQYLSEKNCKHLQLILARTTENGPFTLILAGIDERGKHIYTDGGKVFQHCYPCPDRCQSNDIFYVEH